jgi:hypothetical protein
MNPPTRAALQSAVINLAVNHYSLTSATPAVKEVMELVDKYVENALKNQIRKEIEVV